MTEGAASTLHAQAELIAISLDRDGSALTGLLSPDEHIRAQAFRYDQDRQRWVVARAALRTLLAQRLACHPRDLTFCYGEFGKPFLPDAPSLHFNLSRSGGMALVLIASSGPVGVDIEAETRSAGLSECAPSFCHPSESQNPEHLLKIWCGKEAYLKALGTGLTTEPNRIILDWQTDTATPRHEQNFRIHFPEGLSGYCAAATLPAHLPGPVFWSVVPGWDGVGSLALRLELFALQSCRVGEP